MIFVLLIRIFSYVWGFEIVSVFIVLFYGTYVRKVVGKVTRKCGCCMANIDIRCYVIFWKKFLKWICKFIYYIGLG